MKVGIDLSSTNTGVVILDDNNKFIDKKVFNLWKDNKIDFDEIVKLSNFINDTWLVKVNYDIEKLETTNIGIELADFKNANYTNRFNRICGALEFDLWWAPYEPECKIFNSNEWQQHLGLKPGMERQFRKDTARQFTKSNCLEYKDTWTEDECDAYCIAYFLPQLRDRTQMHQEVKVRNKTKAKSEKQALRDKLSKEKRVNKLKDIVIKYKSMEKLTKAQQRALEKAENELKELENEKSI